jgi:hypothetical protein
MADDPHYRSQRPDPYSRDRAYRSASAAKDDPLAELARLIGQDEAFIAASRESARGRQRDVQHEPEREASAPNWLTRFGQRSDAEPGGTADYEPQTGRRDSSYRSDFEPDADHHARHEPAGWDAAPEEDDNRYRESGPNVGHDWHDPPHDPAPEEDVDRYRTAAHHDRYEPLPQDTERYDDEDDRASRIDPFDSRYDPTDHGGQQDEQASTVRRRGGILTVAAVLGLAAVGTAAAFGYRAWTGGSSSTGQPPLIKADTAPTKVVPAQPGEGPQNKLIYDRIGEKIQSSNDRMVSREEQPVEPRDMARQSGARAGMPPPGTPGNVTIGAQPPAYAVPPPPAAGPNEPKRVHTITIRPDQMSGTPGPAEPDPMPSRSVPTTSIGPTTAPAGQGARSTAPLAPSPIKPLAPKPASRAPLALSPPAEDPPPSSRSATAPAQPNPYRTAALPPPAETGNYVVQISSQRSEAEAQASFRALQAKYPSVLGSRQPLIRRADLGSKGVYYRAQVGPFANAEDANQLCSNLKSAGGQCIVQRN